jgi:serine/threonine protein kinase/Flp pilus assembly protein TadD
MDRSISTEFSLSADVDATPAGRLAEQLARQMAESWSSGRRCGADQVLADHPELYEHPDAVVRLIYEEMCQRDGLGEELSAKDFQARFPAFQTELDVLLKCHELVRPARRDPVLPQPGQQLGEFRLLAILGSGALGRVFLAEETFLAARRVVLKVTASDGGEHLSLARLQHTHIVPLYAAREFPDRGLRALCMPCLGGTTLDRILYLLESAPPNKRTGRDILRALTDGVTDPRMHWQGRGSSWQYLERASYVQAICWMGLCAADALHYAHGQGLVHLDLKPSNLLLTADGQPMLLDFHLAREPLVGGHCVLDRLGGTPAYMSPEQSAAWQAVLEGQPLATAVDGRSDVYSLALVLAEALGGGPKGNEPGTRPLAGRDLRHLPTGLQDILARALRANPSDRYADAASFAEDLRRHLTSRPLVGVRNRNPAEWWAKWRQRKPHALWVGGAILALAFVLSLLGRIAWTAERQRIAEAEAALSAGTQRLALGQYSEATASLERSAALFRNSYTGRDTNAQVRRALQLAARGQAVGALNQHTQRLRFAYGNDSLGPEALRAIADFCRESWSERSFLIGTPEAPLQPRQEEQLRTDLLDVAVLWSDLRMRLAEPGQVDEERRQVLVVLRDAESLFGRSAVVAYERRALGDAVDSDAREPQTTWEHYAIGRWRLRQGDLAGAATELDRAVALGPQSFWPWFLRGLCAHKGRQFEEAVTSFTVCTALLPGGAESYYNRALAHAARGQTTLARADYDRALDIDTGLSAALLNRGVLNVQEKRLAEAENDLARALTLGADAAAVHFNLALVYQARHDRDRARASVERSLRYRPGYREASELRDRLMSSRL